MRSSAILLTLAFGALTASPALASQERIALTQSTGHIVANVYSTLPVSCSVVSTFLYSQTNHEFVIVTNVASTDCFDQGPQIPFAASVDFGVVPDGSYIALWFYANVFGPFGNTTRQPFSVRNGALV